MPRSQAQSDFKLEEPGERVENEASEGSTRWMLRLTLFVLVVLVLLTVIGPHIPSGE